MEKNETKLASYHNTSFDKICLGMTENDVTNWILVDYAASSLYSVIAEGITSETKAGRAEWMSLINGAELQPNCNKEGFNVQCSYPSRKSRIGIFGNDKNNCGGCDSVIGFGFQIRSNHWSSGNIKTVPTVQKLKSFGYIFVQ